jgi:hypothetical protein
MEGANERVRYHADRRDELHLFEDLDKGFLRQWMRWVLAGWKHQNNVPDVNGKQRRAIVFYLSPVHAESVSNPPPLGYPRRPVGGRGGERAARRECCLSVPGFRVKCAMMLLE